MDIEEIEEFLNSIDIPDEAIPVSMGIIHNPKLFIESHINICKRYKDSPLIFTPYYDRLKSMVNYLKIKGYGKAGKENRIFDEILRGKKGTQSVQKD